MKEKISDQTLEYRYPDERELKAWFESLDYSIHDEYNKIAPEKKHILLKDSLCSCLISQLIDQGHHPNMSNISYGLEIINRKFDCKSGRWSTDINNINQCTCSPISIWDIEKVKYN